LREHPGRHHAHDATACPINPISTQHPMLPLHCMRAAAEGSAGRAELVGHTNLQPLGLAVQVRQHQANELHDGDDQGAEGDGAQVKPAKTHQSTHDVRQSTAMHNHSGKESTQYGEVEGRAGCRQGCFAQRGAYRHVRRKEPQQGNRGRSLDLSAVKYHLLTAPAITMMPKPCHQGCTEASVQHNRHAHEWPTTRQPRSRK
jgi:hypothetical protein